MGAIMKKFAYALMLTTGAAALAVGSGAAHAQSVFVGQQAIGSATASYTVTTDGATGILQRSDLLSFTAILTNGATTVTFDTTAPYFLGDALSSDGTNLYFDFDASAGSYFGIPGPSSPESYDYICWQASDSLCFYPSVAAVGMNLSGTFSGAVNPAYVSAQSGNQVIGSVVPAALPEPSTWALMLLGFLGIGIASRRNRQSNPLPQLA
jgi:hypothetical protein